MYTVVCFILTVHLADKSGLILFKAKVDLQWLIIMFVERKQRQALFLIWSLNQMTPWTVLETPLCCFVQFQGTGNCFGLPLDKLTYSYSYLSSQGHMLVLCYLASAQWWNQSKMNCWWRAKYYFLFFKYLFTFQYSHRYVHYVYIHFA